MLRSETCSVFRYFCLLHNWLQIEWPGLCTRNRLNSLITGANANQKPKTFVIWITKKASRWWISGKMQRGAGTSREARLILPPQIEKERNEGSNIHKLPEHIVHSAYWDAQTLETYWFIRFTSGSIPCNAYKKKSMLLCTNVSKLFFWHVDFSSMKLHCTFTSNCFL